MRNYSYAIFHRLTGKFLGQEFATSAKEAIKGYLLDHPMMNEQSVKAERIDD